MFRSERFVGQLANRSLKMSSKPMLVVFWGLLAALGLELGSFAGLFYTLHVETPWLLAYATIAGFLIWKFAFHTVLPSPVLDRITYLVDQMSASGEGVCHQICRDVYRDATTVGFWLMALNILSVFWGFAFLFPSNIILGGLIFAALFTATETLCSWRPLSFFMSLLRHVDQTCGKEDAQEIVSSILDIPFEPSEDSEPETSDSDPESGTSDQEESEQSK